MAEMNYGAQPVYEIGSGGSGDGFANSWIWVFFLFFLLAWGGNGGGMFGGGNNAATTAGLLGQAQLQQDLFSQTQDSQLRGLAQGQCDLTSQIMQNKYEGAIQTSNSQFAIMNQMATNESARQMCCCETNRNIDSLKYENAQNTSAIIQADNANTQRILDAMCENTIQDLRDKLQTAQLDANNATQTATLISTLRPFPQPAYITASPYTSAFGTSGCTCGL